MNTCPAFQISEHVWWVGAVDWQIRDFHGYTTNRGSTYNAYLILADKITLVDTVKAPFKDELLSRIASVIDPARIDYIVSNHAEMDHSGCLPEVIAAVRPEKVFASPLGVKALHDHHGLTDITAVKSGENIDLGNMELSFLETRMLHWPDSMFSYLGADRVLFSQDAFGMHLASAERFADEMSPDILSFELATYFANILLPYAPQVQKLLDSAADMDLDLAIVAPDHGPVWRQGFSSLVDHYTRWARQQPTDKAVVLYDTMWHSTEKMARAVAEGLSAGGARVKVMGMHSCHRSEVVYELLEAGALVAGSPTLNNNLLPSMADVLTYVRGLRPRNLVGAAFGSYGWSGESAAQVAEQLAAMKVEMVAEPLKVKYVPTADDLERCFVLGGQVASRMGGGGE